MTTERSSSPVFRLLWILTLLLPFSRAAVSPADPSPLLDPRTGKPWFFLGLDAGYAGLTSSVAGEENKSGIDAALKVLLSYYFDREVLDGGLGYDYKTISGKRNSGVDYTLETNTLNFEIGARYRFTPSWQLGPFLFAQFGADVSQRPTQDPILVNEPPKSIILLTGLQGFYERMTGQIPLRIGLRALTGVNISNRRLFEVQASVQIGFPLGSAPSSPAVPTTHPVARAPSQYFDVTLYKVYFALDSVNLTSRSTKRLERIGRWLARNRERFTGMEVQGHTDRSGTEMHNLDLSARRAFRVTEVLITQGVPRAKVTPRGLASEQPAVEPSRTVEAKNRRVQIRLFGIGHNDPFLRDLVELANED